MNRVSVEIEAGQYLVDDLVDAGVLQANRVKHAHRRFIDPVWRIAEAGLARRALQHDCADVRIGEALYPRIFLAKADAAGQQHDRRVEWQAAEVDLQRI